MIKSVSKPLILVIVGHKLSVSSEVSLHISLLLKQEASNITNQLSPDYLYLVSIETQRRGGGSDIFCPTLPPNPFRSVGVTDIYLVSSPYN